MSRKLAEKPHREPDLTMPRTGTYYEVSLWLDEEIVMFGEKDCYYTFMINNESMSGANKYIDYLCSEPDHVHHKYAAAYVDLILLEQNR